MRLMKIDQKTNTIIVVPDVLDDLWHLERIIDAGDLISGSTDRKIKREDFQKSERIKLFLTLETQTVEFHRFSGKLRVNGTITHGKPAELIELGSYHSLELEEGTSITIQKKDWKEYQIARLKKAQQATQDGVLVLCVLDDEFASFAILKHFSLELKGNLSARKQGKQYKGEDGRENKFFQEMVEKTLEMKPDKIVFAGPGFTVENFSAYIKEKQSFDPKIKIFYDKTNSVGKTGLHELLKNDILEKIVNELQIIKETKMIELVLERLGKSTGTVSIGIPDVKDAVARGAVELVVASEKLLLEDKESVEQLLLQTEKLGGEIHLVVSEHEAARQLDSLGGIAALLRYALHPAQ